MSSTHELEDGLVKALRTIRECWPIQYHQAAGGATGPRSTDEVTTLDRWVSLRHETHLCLLGWARVVVEDRELSHGLPSGYDTLGLCELLERHAQWFSGHDAAPDAVAEIEGAAGRLRAVVIPKRREWVNLGDCPLEVPTRDAEGLAPCGGQVRAYPTPEGATLAERIIRQPTCQSCGTEASVEWWEAHMFPEHDVARLLTADAVATFVHSNYGEAISKATIRQWVKRGILYRDSIDDKWRSLYDRAHVVIAMTKRERLRELSTMR